MAAYHAEVEAENKRRHEEAEKMRLDAQLRMEEERKQVQARLAAE